MFDILLIIYDLMVGNNTVRSSVCIASPDVLFRAGPPCPSVCALWLCSAAQDTIVGLTPLQPSRCLYYCQVHKFDCRFNKLKLRMTHF